MAKNEKQKEQETEILVQDIPCEEAVLGAILQDNNILDEYREQLTAKCFYKLENEAIWGAIVAVRERGDIADPINVHAQLQKMATGLDITLFDLGQILGKAIRLDLPTYVWRLHDLAARRELWRIAVRLKQVGTSELTDTETAAEQARTALNDVYSTGNKEAITLKEGVKRLYELINANFANGGNTSGTLTGFKFLDDKGGLQPSDLIIIAGETSMGKTSFANSLTLNAMKNGKRVAFCSLEMVGQQIAARMTAILSGISSYDLLNRALSNEELHAFDKAIGGASSYLENLFIDDRNFDNIESIVAFIRAMKHKNGIDGAVIDYLQILSVSSRATSEEKHMADVARRLKNLAKELGIWIIALSQLNRNTGESQEPTLNRLRSSGQIAEAADVVMLIYRPDEGKPFPPPFDRIEPQGKSLINVAKGRNIGTGKFLCGFHPETTRFYELGDEPLEERTTKIAMPF